jgi:hypothetical protein
MIYSLVISFSYYNLAKEHHGWYWARGSTLEAEKQPSSGLIKPLAA